MRGGTSTGGFRCPRYDDVVEIGLATTARVRIPSGHPADRPRWLDGRVATPEDYDRLADGYARMRRPDPRIAAAIAAALGDARRIVNVGAGTGSYEPSGREVIAVEPSAGMIAARPPGSAPAVRASAEALPFPDDAFDAALAILTVHHWTDQAAGLGELVRVARRRVVVTWDPAFADAFWLTSEYLPAIAAHDRTIFAPLREVADRLGGARAEVLEIPADCRDGFLCAYWRRPEAYLDPAARAGISSFSDLPAAMLGDGLGRLEDDLRSGAFWSRHAHLRERTALDLGYRILIAGGG